jgi:hypothetical protein
MMISWRLMRIVVITLMLSPWLAPPSFAGHQRGHGVLSSLLLSLPFISAPLCIPDVMRYADVADKIENEIPHKKMWCLSALAATQQATNVGTALGAIPVIGGLTNGIISSTLLGKHQYQKENTLE